jgi:TM2 domain-containing membrane protein YozV
MKNLIYLSKTQNKQTMKKLLMICAMLGAFATASFAADGGNAYKANDEKIDQLFASATEVSVDQAIATDLSTTFTAATLDGEKSKGGFLLRAFFCGSFALHRSYMGTGGKGLFLHYFCTGGFVACVDFWWVIFKGDEAFNKFKDNPKWIVW